MKTYDFTILKNFRDNADPLVLQATRTARETFEKKLDVLQNGYSDLSLMEQLN